MANCYANCMDSYSLVRFWQYLQGKKCADMRSYITECIFLSYSRNRSINPREDSNAFVFSRARKFLQSFRKSILKTHFLYVIFFLYILPLFSCLHNKNLYVLRSHYVSSKIYELWSENHLAFYINAL